MNLLANFRILLSIFAGEVELSINVNHVSSKIG